jgi:hypothetical protein
MPQKAYESRIAFIQTRKFEFFQGVRDRSLHEHMVTRRSKEDRVQPRRYADRNRENLEERAMCGLQGIKAPVRQNPLPNNRQSQLLLEKRAFDEQ